MPSIPTPNKEIMSASVYIESSVITAFLISESYF